MPELIIGHTSFLGHSGYASHARNFFTELNNYTPVKIRNFAHDANPDYLTQTQRNMLIKEGEFDPFSADYIHIVLLETHHYYFYHNYNGPKIAYNVWEATKQPKEFFNRLLEYDQFWCPTKWQAECTAAQGYPKDKIRIVPEGVDGTIFRPGEENNDRFRFLIFGRWDYRKSIRECIEAFLKADLDAELVISVDNPFETDGLDGTEKRLEYYGLNDSRIKILHFPPNQEYLRYLQGGNVFLSCSRAEGWNLPLMEAMACGIPAICSSHGSQSYADVAALKVPTKCQAPPKNVFNADQSWDLGYWDEPDFDALVDIIRGVYNNYSTYKTRALEASEYIREKFTWDNAVRKAYENICQLENPSMELYQDQWVNGKVLAKGKRDCEGRYNAIKQVFDGYKRPFTILDIGANFGYYSIRAAQEYGAISVMIENKDEECDRLIKLAEQNDCRDKLIVLKNTMTLEKLEELSKCEHFDVVLALNVIHHFDENVDKVCEVFTKLGDNLIIETPPPWDTGACGQSNLQPVYSYFKDKSTTLGSFKRHTSNTISELWHINTPKNELTHTYYGWNDLYNVVDVKLHYLLDKKPLQIFSNLDSKTFYNPRKDKTFKWINGINLKTFMELGGVYPYPENLVDKIIAKNVETDYAWDNSSNDIVLHNIIMEGHKLHLIDYVDELVFEENIGDEKQLVKIAKILSGEKIRLNLGCGNDIKQGWVNIDRFNGNADEQWDILDMPIPDMYADEALISHVLEHFPVRDVPTALMEWNRVLKIGGKLIIKVPDFEAAVSNWQKADDKWETLLLGIYGGQSHEGNYHFCGFTAHTLSEIATSYGFKVNKCESDGWQLVMEATKQSNFKIPKIESICHFVDGPFIELKGSGNNYYAIDFDDMGTKSSVDSHISKLNRWRRPYRKWFTDWKVRVSLGKHKVYEHKFDLTGKRALITLDSKSLGDSLCWIPYVEEFRKKHNCHVIVATFWNKLFKSVYPELEFVEPGQEVKNLYASYTVGCWEGDINRNKNDWRTIPLQQIASDMLGLPFEEIKPRIASENRNRPYIDRYVCISEWSTLLRKHWLYKGGWQQIVDYLNSIGYKVVVVSKEKTNLRNIEDRTNRPIMDTINTIKHCEFYIGLGHGPAWLAWALDKPVIMISGFSDYCEFSCNRITPEAGVCHGCFNDINLPFDRGGWDICPRGKNFECSKSITPERIIKEINKIIKR